MEKKELVLKEFLRILMSKYIDVMLWEYSAFDAESTVEDFVTKVTEDKNIDKTQVLNELCKTYNVKPTDKILKEVFDTIFES